MTLPAAPLRDDLAAALRTTWPVLLGYLPLGAAFGVLLVAAGFPWWWAPIWSVFMYAGSMQYLAVDLVAGGAGLAQAAVATFFVNFRHVFYGLSFPLDKVRGRAARAYSVHALTDEAYAVLAPYRSRPATSRFLVASQVLCHTYWITGSTLGAALGAGFGLDVPGLDFVLTALFAVLAIEAYRADPDRATLLVALACALGAWLVAGAGMLVPALAAFVAILLVRWFAVERHRAPDGRTGNGAAAPGPGAPGPGAPVADADGGLP